MAKRLIENEVRERLSKLATWEIVPGEPKIRRKFLFKNFSSALEFVNRVGAEAEAMDHHPDIFLHDYKHVTLTLMTHSEGGLTRLDFDLASKIENAFQELQNLTATE